MQVCTATCCSETLNKPYHPTGNFNGSKKQQGKQMRSFQKSWLTEFPWVAYWDSRHIVFCFYCHQAKSKGFLTFSKNIDDAFTASGFSNWKKA